MNISRTLYSCEHTEYAVSYTPDVVYAHRETGDLKLQIVMPEEPILPPPANPPELTPVQKKYIGWKGGGTWKKAPDPDERYPLILACPGSGWAGAEGYRYLPHLVELARHGFVAAAIGYRGVYKDNVVYPATVQDMRDALRFLCETAVQWHIDAARIGLMGDSSGGNTAAMAALAGESLPGLPDHPTRIGEQPENVKALCLIYAPVDAVNLAQDRIAEGLTLRPGEEPGRPFECMELWQEEYLKDPDTYLKAASPLYCLEEGKPIPPVLFVQGDADLIIPQAQGLRFCDRVRACGGRAEYVKVCGGGHGTGVWGKEMLETVAQFFGAYL